MMMPGPPPPPVRMPFPPPTASPPPVAPFMRGMGMPAASAMRGVGALPFAAGPSSLAGAGGALSQGAPALATIGKWLPIIQGSAKWLPAIRRYGPMIKQIPFFLQKMGQYTNKNVSKPQLPPKGDVVEKHSDTETSPDPKTLSNKETSKVASIEEPFVTNEWQEGELPPPKLYI